jgi:molybdopterin synthase sulfur carrier subunit
MMPAVSDARRRSLVHTATNVAPVAASSPAASARPSASAWARPRSVKAMSAEPCQRRTAFHSLCPWRTSSTPRGFAAGASDWPVDDIPGDASPGGTLRSVAIVRLFASAREAAGTGRDELPGATVGEVLHAARDRYGAGFEAVLATCRIWVNGESADDITSVGAHDEVAILPPVSGG